VDASSEGAPLRMASPEPRFQANTNDVKVEIPEFNGKLGTVEHVFEYKDVPEDKKVKLVALRLRKYAWL